MNAIVYLTKYIFTLLIQDGTYLQKLIQPTTDSGQKRTVQDLLDDFGTPGVRKAGKFLV